ncbi:MAG: hypothetical protein WBG50_16205 [Desulfomonilaceae bacterium]
MSDLSQDRIGKVPLNNFLADFRSILTDHELRQKYELTARGFVSLIKALLARNLITTDDLAKRREMAVQRDLAKESEFLSGLYICRHCSHPSPHPFKKCPACGADAAESPFQEESIDSALNSLGQTNAGMEEEEIEVEVIEDTGDTRAEETPRSEKTKKSSPAKSSRKNETPRGEEAKDTTTGRSKPSALGDIRSFLSKLKKK